MRLITTEATYPDEVIKDIRELGRKSRWEGDWLSLAVVYVGCGICQEISELTDAVQALEETVLSLKDPGPKPAKEKKDS